MAVDLKTMHVPFVDLSAQYAAIREEVDDAIHQVLSKTNFILGHEVEHFEQAFASYCEAQYAIGVDTGTAALELILRAYGIGPGDEVITVTNTFIATALAIAKSGATPVLVDADPLTYNLDPCRVEQAITARTKAIIPVHLYGLPADMDALMELAHAHGLYVFEDACQAHGARYKGRRVGSIGDAGAFSFYPAKNLGAFGDGGLVVTNNERVAQSIRMYRNYGQRQKYHHEVIGYNHRLDTLHAAVLSVKLKYLDAWNDARREHAADYNRLLASMPIALPPRPEYAEPVHHLYVIRVQARDELQAYLGERGIATGIHYPLPVHCQPAFRHLACRSGDFPVAEQYADQLLSLPMYPELPPEQIAATAAAIGEFMAD